MIKPDLNSKRMGHEPDPYFEKVNMLIGLDEMCRDIGLNKNSILLEIGSYFGVSTSLFAFYCSKVYAVDVWLSPELKNSIIPKHKNIEFILGSSLEIIPSFENNFFDVVYIDGDHSYEAVKQDIINSIPKLKSGGYICGHDYDSFKKNDTYKAVNEHFGTPHKVYEDQSWMIKIERK